MSRARIWTPLAAFVVILATVAWGIYSPRDPNIRSALVGKPLPDFTLAPITAGKPGVTAATFRKGQPRLLNIFASWCVPCAAEAPQLAQLTRAGVPIDGVAVRDTPEALAQFFAQYGNPYQSVGSDPQSRLQLAIGSSGVPESYVIDGQGRIVLQHIGDIRAENAPEILAAMQSARK